MATKKSDAESSSPARPLSILGKIAVTAATVYIVRKLAARKLPGEKVHPDFDLRDHVVLITGGSRGLGLALALEFGARGARLALCARDESELQEACRVLDEKGIKAVPFVADIRQAAETQSLLQRVMQQFGKLDILVNNAGEIQVAPLKALSREDFENSMDLMFWAPVNLSLAALPHFAERRSGRIVNITSIGGRVSVPHLLPYSCAKFALVGFSSGLAAEAKSSGIHVLTVVPGLMRTGSYLHAKFGGKSKSEFTWFGLLGNLPGLSTAADSAAKTILTALQKNQYNCTISLPAKLLVAAEALLPNTTRSMMTYVSRVLPDASGPTPQRTGEELNPQLNSVFQAFTTLGRKAARAFNE
jgi:NAD(P)-dependent dehydrogenase (short-subunit alcohol dehydrogenase family)